MGRLPRPALPPRRCRQAARRNAGDGAHPLAAMRSCGQQALLLSSQASCSRGCCSCALCCCGSQLLGRLLVQAGQRREGGSWLGDFSSRCRHAIQDHRSLVHICRLTWGQGMLSEKTRCMDAQASCATDHDWLADHAHGTTSKQSIGAGLGVGHICSSQAHPCWARTSRQQAPGRRAPAPPPAATPHPCGKGDHTVSQQNQCKNPGSICKWQVPDF